MATYFATVLIASGKVHGPRNPWAGSWSAGPSSCSSCWRLVVIPLFRTETLPKRERLTMLIYRRRLQLPMTRGFQCHIHLEIHADTKDS